METLKAKCGVHMYIGRVKVLCLIKLSSLKNNAALTSLQQTKESPSSPKVQGLARWIPVSRNRPIAKPCRPQNTQVGSTNKTPRLVDVERPQEGNAVTVLDTSCRTVFQGGFRGVGKEDARR
jgi:hypothetical protein